MDSVFNNDRRSLEAFASLELTPREAEVLLWISRGKSNHDLQARRAYFWQTQCGKPHDRCSDSARNVPLYRKDIQK